MELDKLHKLSGELKARKNTYDKEEQQYNQRYATRLQRNLMGLYDDGMLDILGEELADKLTALTKNIADNSEAIAKTEEAAQNYEREIQSIQTKQMQNHRDIDHGEMQLQELNKQLAQRQDMLKYANLPEKEIYNGQLIQTKLVERCSGCREIFAGGKWLRKLCAKNYMYWKLVDPWSWETSFWICSESWILPLFKVWNG